MTWAHRVTAILGKAQTVQYHLDKVFPKLGISSRGQLRRVLPGDLEPGAPR